MSLEDRLVPILTAVLTFEEFPKKSKATLLLKQYKMGYSIKKVSIENIAHIKVTYKGMRHEFFIDINKSNKEVRDTFERKLKEILTKHLIEGDMV